MLTETGVLEATVVTIPTVLTNRPKIEVKPIDRKQWHNKKGKESFTLPKIREVLYDQDTGEYATGL